VVLRGFTLSFPFLFYLFIFPFYVSFIIHFEILSHCSDFLKSKNLAQSKLTLTELTSNTKTLAVHLSEQTHYLNKYLFSDKLLDETRNILMKFRYAILCFLVF
jgi:hypothetical protein